MWLRILRTFSLTLVAAVFVFSESLRKGLPVPPSHAAFAQTNRTAEGASGISLLTPNQSVTADLAGGETHPYRIHLNAGEYFHAAVQQRGIDLGLAFLGPGGDLIVELDCRQREVTPLSSVARASGIYRLEVRSLEKGQLRGRYELQVEKVRAATVQDDYRIAGEKSFAEAEQLMREGKTESTQLAIGKYQEAITNWQTAAAPREEAYTLKRIGDAHQSFSQLQNALDFYQRALTLYRQTKDRRGEGVAGNEICSIYTALGRNDQALRHCMSAIKLSRDVGNREGEAQALNNLGEVNNWSGKLQSALDYYRQALSIWTELNDRRGQAQTNVYFGYTYSDLGQTREAFGFYNQALSVWQATHDQRAQAITLTAIGRLYSRVGESQEALDFFERALPLARSVGDPIEEGRILNGMAYTYDQLGEKQMAIEHYDRVFPLFRAAGYSKGEATTLYDAGRVYNSLGESRKALEYYQQAVAISKANGDRRLESFELREIGRVYDSLGDKKKALDNYLLALRFWQAGKDFRAEVDTLNPMGQIYEGWGQRQKALDSYNRALQLSRTAAYPFGEAAALHNLAHIERDRGNLTVARARAEEALAVIEVLREKVSSQDLRTSYFASVRQQYEFYIDLLMSLHRERPTEAFDAAAFEASERARARSLLETLAVARVGIRQQVDPALLAEESKLREGLNQRATRRMQLQSNHTATGAEAASLAHEIDELTWQLRGIEAKIRASGLEHAAAFPAQPLDLKTIQGRLLDDDTLLLEYSLGDERSYLWVVSKTTLQSYELPARATIEKTAQQVYNLLTANQPRADERIEERQFRIQQAQSELPAEIARLSELLLGRLAGRLGRKRLLIVADGPLQYIPFQSLSVPLESTTQDSAASSSVASEQRPLILDHEIVNQPSASAMALVLSESTNRIPASLSVAILADPVFEMDDPRLTSLGADQLQAASPALQPGEVTRAFRDVGQLVDGRQIPRLLASRQEAEAIMSVVPWHTGFKAVDFDANRATVMGADMGRYRIVHFATHALLDNERPELSGIVLSLVNQQGQKQDGFLRLHDIYNLKLPVDLVVLSACQTGLGKDVKGEGLIGLTRGFMYAGASGVVASLWKVDDDATAELMTHFYDGMFKRGLTPAAALQEAQLALRRQKRWQAPYYWGAFVIQGRYDQHLNSTSRSTPIPRLVIVAILGGGLLLGIFFLLRRRRRRIL